MTERERLIDLLNEAEYAYLEFSKMYPYTKSLTDFTADYLLSNGVIVPPCKVGDTVYIIPKYDGNPYCGVVSDKIQMIGITNRGIHIKTRGKSNFNKTYMLGKTVFLTREEAEQALKKNA